MKLSTRTRRVLTYLERDDKEEEEDHVDDAVDDNLLYRDEQQHPSADEDPVFAHHLHQEMT